ncbi:MAG: amidophosphoribosyltransferase, partial [Oscillospiraceae bacterium]
MEHFHEECGVFAVFDRRDEVNVKSATYSALYALQHRGQESCGMAVSKDGQISYYRDLGLVNDVFTQEIMNKNFPD